MSINALNELALKPTKLLFEDSLSNEDKKQFALYESNNGRFVSLVNDQAQDNQGVLNRISNYRLQAQTSYQLTQSKTYFVTPSVLVEARNKVTDGQIHDANKLSADFDKILKIAIDRGVSDVHIFVRPLKAEILFRQYGEMMHFRDYDVSYINALVSVIYNDLGEEKSKDIEFSADKIQETVIERFIEQKKYRIRFSSINIVSSDAGLNKNLVSPYHVSLRILSSDSSVYHDFKSLGYRSDYLDRLNQVTHSTKGAVIVSGELNSGKSTTLQVMLSAIRKAYPQKHIFSIESPVEYVIDGVTQHPIHTTVEMREEDINKAYVNAMNAAARRDLNIAYINEIRNEDTAKFGQRIAQSGHLFFSTIHAQSALNIVNRLVAMGVDQDVLCSPNFIQLLVHQSLLQRVCSHCSYSFTEVVESEKHTEFKPLLAAIDGVFSIYAINGKDKQAIRFRNLTGCDQCKSGISGLTVVAEMVKPTGKLLQLLNRKSYLDAYIHWRHSGALTLKEDAIIKMLNGEVCPSSLSFRLGAIDDVEMVDLFEDKFFIGLLNGKYQEVKDGYITQSP